MEVAGDVFVRGEKGRFALKDNLFIKNIKFVFLLIISLFQRPITVSMAII